MDEPPPKPVLTSLQSPPAEPSEAVARGEPAAVEAERVVELRPPAPREWNVWQLERLAREQAGFDAARDEEWSYPFMYLREFASAEGSLPLEFDGLVRESFGELLVVGR